MWKHLGGPLLQTTVKCGAGAAIAVGMPMVESAGTMVAMSDGVRPTHVSKAAMVASTDFYEADYLVPGSKWRVPCSGLTAARGTLVYAAGAENVDGGSATNEAIGRVVNHDCGATDTTVDIVIVEGIAHA